MNPLTRLMLVVVCVLPSLTLQTQEEHWRHRRHRHPDHQISELGHHRHSHHYTHYLAPKTYLPSNSLYGNLVTKEPAGVTSGFHVGSGSRWVAGDSMGGTGSRWSLTYPGTPHQSSAINNTVQNVTAQLGGSAFLPCRVGHLGDRQISWIRRRDWHVLTSADVLYTLDRRFSVLHVAGSQDWTLHIMSVEVKDEGMYECHVSTGTGIISLFVNLEVVTPEAHITGRGHYHVNHGSPITLTCVINQSPSPPQHVLWHHNGQLLNYAHNRPEVKVSMKVAGRAVSSLHVDRASDYHSGNYTCSARNTKPATTRVFVTQGDKTAAVQRIDSNSITRCRQNLSLLPLVLSLMVAVR
ncbi:hypothetical protein Pcinc_044207 [Petrolisthes cinctipes]|uniref:Ig-like domain-containing protein n=1 Tax=Petrolisthes cinctipes TaxID=88211 RepID=A0AAE1BF85_PETCI|nr:hypothetical protein Pcinc_044207 [Petrolisthes cinctipes]